MKLKFIFAWYDMWVGAYWDGAKRRLYILPLPMIGFYIQCAPKKESLPYYFSDGGSEWIERHTREFERLDPNR